MESYAFINTLVIYAAHFLGELIRIPLLLLPFFILFKIFKCKGTARRVVFSLVLVVVVSLGAFIMRAGVICWYSVTDPEQVSSFSLSSPAIEASDKGMSFERVVSYFEEYKQKSDLPDLKLCRKCFIRPSDLLNYYNGFATLRHPRWQLPRCKNTVSRDN
jgi:hypothetical protein